MDISKYPAQEGGQKHVTVTDGATIEASEGGKTVTATNDGKDVPAEGEDGKVEAKDNPFDIQGGTLTVAGKADTDNVSKYVREGYEYI